MLGLLKGAARHLFHGVLAFSCQFRLSIPRISTYHCSPCAEHFVFISSPPQVDSGSVAALCAQQDSGILFQ